MTEEKYLQKLGQKISKKRELLGLSVVDLAQEIGLSRIHVYRIEAGENPTNILVLRRIAKVFEIDLSELINVE
jgi:transcriptional regulator with XRE-family HTH domain